MKVVAIKELKSNTKGILAAGLPQDPRAYRKSPLPRAVVSTDLLDAERRDR